MKCHAWSLDEAMGMQAEVMLRAAADGPQRIRGRDAAEYVLVTLADYAALLTRLDLTVPEAMPGRVPDPAEIDRHLAEFCGVPADLDARAAHV